MSEDAVERAVSLLAPKVERSSYGLSPDALPEVTRRQVIASLIRHTLYELEEAGGSWLLPASDPESRDPREVTVTPRK